MARTSSDLAVVRSTTSRPTGTIIAPPTPATDRLLTALEELVRRHRALPVDDEHDGLRAELIAAEVAHELSITRSALLRHRPLPRLAG